MRARRAFPACVAALALIGLLSLALSSCGKSTLSAPALRRDATRVCTIAQRRAGAIELPRSTKAAAAFLVRGLAVLAPEVAQLRLLSPPAAAAPIYKRAVDALAAQLTAISSTIKQIDHGRDSVTAFRALQAQLAPLESRAGAAFHALGIEACSSR